MQKRNTLQIKYFDLLPFYFITFSCIIKIIKSKLYEYRKNVHIIINIIIIFSLITYFRSSIYNLFNASMYKISLVKKFIITLPYFLLLYYLEHTFTDCHTLNHNELVHSFTIHTFCT